MSRSRVIFFLVSAVLVFPILAGTLLLAADRQEPQEDSLYKYLAIFSEVLGMIRQAHVDEPDMNALMAGALDGTTDALDPFSLYIPAGQVEGYLDARAVGRRHTGMTLLKESGIAYVVTVEKGSPAGLAGVQPGDLISKVDGRSTRLMPLWEIQEIMAGKPGTKVELDFLRLGETVKASFELKEFEPPAPSLETLDRGVVMLRIPNFDGETAAQVRELLKRPEAAAGGKAANGRLLVDLRGVSVGEASEAYATAGLFASGDLGALMRRAQEVEAFSGQLAPSWKGKMVVLVDRGTLGPGEIFATVLRQKEIAELVGERTFGYAGRQEMAELSSGGRLLITGAFYSGPDRKPLNESLKPDLLVNERSRTFLEREVPMTELILRRGVSRVLGEDQETAKKAA
ncbi:MAG TPA: S41 family peptidase [Thermoanaerobaculia bacterium]|nr:S41 family peptidase [Thermoanaerobaculia bacterium]